MTGDYLSLTGAVLTVIFVLILAYWCSRALGKNWTRSSAGRNIHVIEQIHIGADRQLLLIKIQDNSYLIGVSAAGIQMLAEIEGELDETAAGESGYAGPGFRELMKRYASLQQKKRGGDK